MLFAVAPFPRVKHGHKQASHASVGLFRQPLLLLMTAALLIYVGVELGVSSWSSMYAVKVLAIPVSIAAFTVALFWLGLLTGRLTISFGYQGDRQELLMLALSTLSTAALVAVLVVRSPAAIAAAIFIAGLGCSGFYPLGMSLLGRHFKSGVAVGTAATGGAAGSIAFPFVMAVISQSVGIRNGFWFYLGMNILLVVVAGLLVWVVRRNRRADGSGQARAKLSSDNAH